MLPAVTAPTEERRAVSFRSLAFAALVFGCLIAAGMWVAYAKLIHYERRATLHLPPEPDFVARLEVEQVALFEPVRRHLLPLINRLPLAHAPDHAGAIASDRLALLREHAGLNLGFDLREILVATAQGGQRWVLVLGGLFPRQGLVSSIERALAADGVSGLTRAGDALLFAPWDVALGQATDGTLILASHREVLESALSPSARSDELGIASEGAGSVLLSGEAFRSAWGRSEDSWQAAIERISVTLQLAQQFELATRIELRPAAEPRAVLAGLERGAAAAGAPAFFDPRADWAAEWLSSARSSPLDDSENVIKFTASWRTSELDRNARGLASWLERQFSSPLPGSP